MIKEKDYPHFCYPEGKEKFERFVRNFNIDGKGNLPRYKKYLYFRQDESGSFLQDKAMNITCDHSSVWFHKDKETGRRIYYIVFQSYGDVDTILKEMQNSKDFIFTCAENNFHVELYSNHKYNWHNENMVTVIVELDSCEENRFFGSYPVEINVRDTTPGAYRMVCFKFIDKVA